MIEFDKYVDFSVLIAVSELIPNVASGVEFAIFGIDVRLLHELESNNCMTWFSLIVVSIDCTKN